MSSSSSVTLDFVLGHNPSAVACLSSSDESHQLAFANGPMVVLQDSASRAQRILRGHVRHQQRCSASSSVLLFALLTHNPLPLFPFPS